jgi:Tol biopolymer transport system component
VSVSSSGAQANKDSFDPSISAAGRVVAFESFASDLVPGDTNGLLDVFVHHARTAATRRVTASGGFFFSGPGLATSISADGRFVAETNGSDVFVHDLRTGEATLVSVSSSGAEANGRSDSPSISADGRFVAFRSSATNLVAGDTSSLRDVFVHDLATGKTRRVSVSSSGAEANDESATPSISADGRLVAFESDASNLVRGDTNRSRDVFVHNLRTGKTRRVSVSSCGRQGNGRSREPAISADGRFVAFDSRARNLVPGDTNHASDIFVHNLRTGKTRRVSVSSRGRQANKPSGAVYHDDRNRPISISAHGHLVAFNSHATNLVRHDTNHRFDIFVHDLRTGKTKRVSVGSRGGQGNRNSGAVSISADGRFVAFDSAASNLVRGDTNHVWDVFRRGPLRWR